MKNRWRVYIFVSLIILMVIGIENLGRNKVVDYKLNQVGHKASVAPGKQKRQRMQEKRPDKPQVVKLFPYGDLYMDPPSKPSSQKTTRPNKKQEPTPKRKQKPAKKVRETKISAQAPQKEPPSNTKKTLPQSRALDGTHPSLEVTYDEIGFPAYLDVIERVGQLFVLIKNSNGPSLGPEISLKNRNITGGKPNWGILDRERPHLVSDDSIQKRLKGISIPRNAFEDRVALFLHKPFNSILWDAITGVLEVQGFKLHQVSKINAKYVKMRNGIGLQIGSAIIRGTGKTIKLDKSLTLML